MEMFTGIFLAIAAGILNGSFAVPTTKIKTWQWENTWLLYALFGMIIFPSLITFIFIPDILNIYAAVPTSRLLTVILLGIGWGIGSVMFGLAIQLLGFSVGYTIVIGGISAFGTLIPLLISREWLSFTWKDMPVFVAIFCTLAGIVFCAKANASRNSMNRSEANKKGKAKLFSGALLIAVTAAILTSMLNLAFYFSKPIADSASQLLGSRRSPFLINHATWTLALFAGFIPFLGFCVWLLLKNNTLRKFREGAGMINLGWTIVMGLVWFACIVLYGIGSSKMGNEGSYLGWLLLMSVTVIAGNIWGFAGNEWKEAPARAKKLMITGICFLIANILIIGIAGMIIEN